MANSVDLLKVLMKVDPRVARSRAAAGEAAGPHIAIQIQRAARVADGTCITGIRNPIIVVAGQVQRTQSRRRPAAGTAAWTNINTKPVTNKNALRKFIVQPPFELLRSNPGPN